MKRNKCPNCGSSDGLAEYDDGDYCYSCHTKHKNLDIFKVKKEEKKAITLPDLTTESRKAITPEEKGWLKSGGLDVHYCSVVHSKEHDRLCFPYFYKGNYRGCWMRALTKKPKWLYAGEKDFCWIYHHEPGIQSSGVVIVEDVVSALRVHKFSDVICLGGTNFRAKEVQDELKKYDKLVAFFDGDGAGREAATEFRYRHKLTHQVKIIRNTKDPKNYTDEELEELLHV